MSEPNTPDYMERPETEEKPRREALPAKNAVLNLYFVSHVNDDGDNCDLFVWSESPSAVIRHWRRYFEFVNELPVRIFQVPTSSRKPGPLRWHQDAAVKCVWGHHPRGARQPEAAA